MLRNLIIYVHAVLPQGICCSYLARAIICSGRYLNSAP